MSEKTTLIGVSHQAKHLPAIFVYLSRTSLKGVKILTEQEESQNKHQHEFYGPLISFLVDQGAVVLHENGYEALNHKAVNEYEDIYGEIHAKEIEALRKREQQANLDELVELSKLDGEIMLAHLNRFLEIDSKYRNPNMIQLITTLTPSLVVIGDGHIREIYPEVKRLLPERAVEYIRIPE